MPALGRLSQPGALTTLLALALPLAAPLQPLAPLSLPCTVARNSFCCVSAPRHARLSLPPSVSLSAVLSAPSSASCSSSSPSRHTIALRSPSTAYLVTHFLLCTRFRTRNAPAIPPPLGAIASSGVATSTRQCAPPHCPGLARPPPPPGRRRPLAAAAAPASPWPSCLGAPYRAPQKP